MSSIDNNRNHVVASEAGQKDLNEELGLLKNSQEEFLFSNHSAVKGEQIIFPLETMKRRQESGIDLFY